MYRIIISIALFGLYSNAICQCENFGAFNVGDDVEITCIDSCVTLNSPSIASVAVGGSDYEVEEIDYALPYPFSQGAVAIATGDDVYSNVIPLGFTFNFFDNSYTQCRISSNGWLSFSTAETNGYNPNGTCPAPSLPLNSIMAVYSDLNPSTCGNVRYATYGVAPCREFVVTWNAICQFSCTSQQVSAEAVLYEGTDVIEVFLGNRQPCSWGNAVVGIQNITGTSGISPVGFNTGNWSANNEAWRFASSEVVEGTTLWYEGDTYLGLGDTLGFCTSQTTTITGWFSQLVPGTFCETYTVDVTSSGSWAGNNQIEWSIASEGGSVFFTDDAPFSGDVCLQNGCYELIMMDSGNNGWDEAEWTLTASDGTVIGPYTLASGGAGSESFCVDGYTGPDPEMEDYVQVVSDDLQIIAVSDVDAEFTFPSPLCSGGEPFQLVPNQESGQWTVACDGCFDEETLTIDPAIAGAGYLQVIHVLDGSCFADVSDIEIFISSTPNPVFNDPPATLCNDEIFDLNATPPYGTWSASCGDCINANSGVFFGETADEGINTITFTTFGVCPGETSVEMGVSPPLEGVISGPAILCEDEVAEFVADVPGLWSSNCFGCMDPTSGVFDPSGVDPDIWTITFTPDSYCPIPAQANIAVSGSVAIGASNVPGSLCETTDEFQLNVNVSGGTWTAPCGTCLAADGLLTVADAGIGILPIGYTVYNGACSDSATWEIDIRPVLEGDLDELGPICLGEQLSLTFTFDADIPIEYTIGASGDWSSSDCPSCILNVNNGLFQGDEVGAVSVTYTFDNGCSEPISGVISIEEPVSATIDQLPELCESEAPVNLTAAEFGGVWAADCDGCIVGGNLFDPSVGAGTYEVTYTISDVCSDEDAIEVVVVPQRDASFMLPDWVCLAAEDLQPTFSWPDGVWTANCENCLGEYGAIDLMIAGVGELEISHVLEGLCGSSATRLLDVVGCDIQFVNVFTPNGDDMNEDLVFEYVQSFPGNHLSIFDRWGVEIYQKTDYGNNWRGEGAVDGTYYYVLKVPGKEALTGSFMLIR